MFVALIILSFNSISQVKIANSYYELIEFQKNLSSKTDHIVVWGQFGSWGKFGWDSYKNICPTVLNQSEYSGLLSALNFHLFSDSATTYYLPIKKGVKISSDFKMGDIIKLKIRLYRNCKLLDGKIYFLIEGIF